MAAIATAQSMEEAVQAGTENQITLQRWLAMLPPRYTKAERIKHAGKVEMDLPKGWNVNKLPYQFQVDDAAWLVVAERGLLGHKVGLGKTIILLLSTMIRKQLGRPYRTLVVCHEEQVAHQWVEAVEDFTDLYPVLIRGPRVTREYLMSKPFDVGFTTYSQLRRDFPFLRRVQIACIYLDEASMYRNHDTTTAQLVKELTFSKAVIHPADATPIQMQLQDMHSIMESIHEPVFPPLPAFQRRFVRFEDAKVKTRNRSRPWIRKKRVVGYRNFEEFKVRIEPFMLRRTKEDPKVKAEARMPKVVVLTRKVELLPRQREMYERVKKGIRDYWDAGERKVAKASYQDLLKVCDSTALMGDPEPQSAKVEYLVRHMTEGDLRDEKVLAFCDFTDYVEEVWRALRAAGVGSVRWTADPRHKEDRRTGYRRFWDERECRAVIGTTALERGGNWQIAGYLLNMSLLWNPKRIEQLVGRGERLFSEHEHFFMVNVIAANTLEERIMSVLEKRSAVADAAFEEVSELFDPLDDDELMELIQD